jgi:hypothetical protein
MLVVNPRALSVDAKRTLTAAYDALCRTEIRALPHIADDEVRGRIDAAIADALGIEDDFSTFRMLLGNEPIISMSLPG